MLADSIVADQYPGRGAIANGKHQSRGIGGIIEGSSSEGLEKVLFLRPEDCSLGLAQLFFLPFERNCWKEIPLFLFVRSKARPSSTTIRIQLGADGVGTFPYFELLNSPIRFSAFKWDFGFSDGIPHRGCFSNNSNR